MSVERAVLVKEGKRTSQNAFQAMFHSLRAPRDRVSDQLREGEGTGDARRRLLKHAGVVLVVALVDLDRLLHLVELD